MSVYDADEVDGGKVFEILYETDRLVLLKSLFFFLPQH